MANPFENLTSIDAIKKAYRKLCLTCHPDMREDKEQAAKEFMELTRIYEAAISSAKNNNIRRRAKPPPPPPPPKPSDPIKEVCIVNPFDTYEFVFFGEATRTVRVSPAMLEYGGTLEIVSKDDYGYSGTFFFVVPPKTKTGQRFRFQLPIGQVEITLVSERK